MTTRVLSFLALLLLLAAPAQAVTTYTYTGGHFGDLPWGPGMAGIYTAADAISGSFTVADGFLPGIGNGGRTAIFLGPGYDGVLDYTFTDGHQTLTPANSTASIAVGIHRPTAADQWEVIIAGATSGLIRTGFLMGERGDLGFLDANNFGGNFSDTINGGGPGAWTVAVPEPMSLVLVIAGIACLFGARRFYRS